MKKRIPAPPSRKRTYTAPKLVRYGDVRLLTQLGTRPAPETGGAGKLPSSRDLKENIARIGAHPLGIGLYLFDYKPTFRSLYGHDRQFGVMADEVEAVMPQAISVNALGHKVVDYHVLGIKRYTR